MIRRLLLYLFLCLSIYFSFENILYAAEKEDSSNTIDMVLVLDISETMDKKIEKNNKITKIDEAKMLAEKLCMLCKSYNIRLSCLTFSGKGKVNEIFKNQNLDTEEAFYTASTKVQEISCKGEYTDQPGAFEKARTLIESAGAKNKYIIMLSDGRIDYVNEGDEDRELTNDECKAVKKFKDSCKEFAAEENQGAFLVGFGNDVDIFSNIEDRENELFYLRWNDDIDTLFESIFGSLDYPVAVKSKDAYWTNELEFDLKDNLYAASVYLAREGTGNVKALTKNLVTMKDQNGNSCQDCYEIFCFQNNAYLFFKRPIKGGKYFLKLPKDNWKYDVYSLKNHRINSVNIMLCSNSIEVVSKRAITEDSQDINVYFVDNTNSDLNIQADVPKKEHNVKSFYVGKNEKGKGAEMQWNEKWKMSHLTADKWTYEIEKSELLPETYYQVRVGNKKGYVYSNIIKIVYTENVKTMDVFTNTEISISEVLFSELNKDEVYNRKLLIDGKEVKKGDENEAYKYNDEKLTFFKKGNYTVELKESIKVKLEVKEKEQEKISWLEKFFNCIKNFVEGIVNAITSFF